MFNNSQIKNHYHTFSHTNTERVLQDVKITEVPLKNNDLKVHNFQNNYRYTDTPKFVSGVYRKTNDGNLVLDIHNPTFSGAFLSDSTNRGIKVESKGHGVAQNSFVNLSFTNINSYAIDNRAYKAYSVIDNNTFFVERPTYTGFLSYYEGTSEVDYAKLIFNKDSLGEDNGAAGLTFVSSMLDTTSKLYVVTPTDGVQMAEYGY